VACPPSRQAMHERVAPRRPARFGERRPVAQHGSPREYSDSRMQVIGHRRVPNFFGGPWDHSTAGPTSRTRDSPSSTGGPLTFDDLDAHLAECLCVRNEVDRDDPLARDLEVEDDARTSARRPNRGGNAVDDGQ
jgi:hypothetical protein